MPLLGALALGLSAAQATAFRPLSSEISQPRFRPLHSLTPGKRNPNVTPSTIHLTVCIAGYSSAHRPPTSITNKLKKKVAAKYGIDPFDKKVFEGDHLIPISIGGDTAADGGTKNFWDEPWHRTYKGQDVGAKTKDGLENYLRRHVCKLGDIGLRRAQREIAEDWYAAWLKYGKPKG